MIDQANAYVRNELTFPIQAMRYCLPGDTKNLDVSVASGNQQMVYLVKDETYLVVKLPTGMSTSGRRLTSSNEELLSCQTMPDHWKVEIKENELDPEAPTTVNVTCGEDENP